MAEMKIEVNGEMSDVAADPETPLLYVLRNDLGLVGSRFGCGGGQCGACFVLVDGRAMASCDLPLWSVAGRKITTVEGLGARSVLHPLQRALIAEQAAQCGYCMSGIVISAVALLANSREPTEAEIRDALDKHLCRCGSHNRVVRAILRAAHEQAR